MAVLRAFAWLWVVGLLAYGWGTAIKEFRDGGDIPPGAMLIVMFSAILLTVGAIYLIVTGWPK